MRIATLIPCLDLDCYLDKVKSQFDDISEKILTVTHDFKIVSEDRVRNCGLGYLQEFDYVFTIDADEFILKKDQQKLIDGMKKGNHDAGFSSILNYTSDFKHFYKRDNHMPVVIVDPKKVKFYDKRCLHFNNPLFSKDVCLHHLGYAMEKSIINKKINSHLEPEKIKGMIKREKFPCSLPEEIYDIMKMEEKEIIIPNELKELLNGIGENK